MKKTFLITLLYIFCQIIPTSAYAVDTISSDSLSKALDLVIENRAYYINQKEQKIQVLRDMLQSTHLNALQEYEINKRLYYEFEKYQTDTALHYLELNKEIATQLKEKSLIDENTIQRAFMYSTKGLFVESKETLDKINTKTLSAPLLSQYYRVYGYYYDHYGQSNGEWIYYQKSDLYRDSLLLSTLDTLSLNYKILNAEDIFYNHQSERAEKMFLELLETTTDNDPERAVIAYMLGAIHKERGDIKQQETYFLMSAIADLVNVIKNNASMHSLALAYYNEGNIDQAYKFMTMAMDDAMQCNVKYRASEAMESYPIINASYQAKELSQKQKLRWYLIFISALVLILICTIAYIYWQMKRVSRIRKELYRSSVKLLELNQDITKTNKRLKETNTQLSEANHVKEEYIAHFFNICSEYIDKMDEYRKSLNRLAAEKSMDELYRRLKSSSIVDTELEELYKRFDNIFLSLFPTFVEEFNNLLIPEEQVVLKTNELLNTELRIFALIRLGITDSVKIANFLRYSLSTIYNYRTQARNKAAVSRNEFEEKVIKIGIHRLK